MLVPTGAKGRLHAQKVSVLVTISAEKMTAISERAKELDVATGIVAGCLLENGVGVSELSKVCVKPPEVCFNPEKDSTGVAS